MNRDTPHVLIAGAGTYGYWNAGDEAIFAATLDDLRAEIPGVRVAVVSANPPAAMAPYDVDEVAISDVPAIFQAARASDLLILGGGGLFYDYWGADLEGLLTRSQQGLGFYTAFALIAALVEKPLMLYGVGVGPLASREARAATCAIFEQAQAAVVRDEASRELLEQIGYHGAAVVVGADAAWALRPDASRALPVLQDAFGGDLPRPLLGVALRPWEVGVSRAEWEAAVAVALDGWIDRHRGGIVFIPLHRTTGSVLTDDTAVAGRVRGLMRSGEHTRILSAEFPPATKAGAVALCDAALTMRLHGLIFAAASGVPFAALAYDPKVSHCLAQAQSEAYGLRLEELAAGRLLDTLEQAYADRAALRESLLTSSAVLARRARTSAVIAGGLMRHPRANVLSPGMAQVLRRAAPVLAERLASREAALEALRAQRRETEAVRELEAKVAARDERIGALQQQAADLRATLDAIYRSRGWRLLQVAWRIRSRLTPVPRATPAVEAQAEPLGSPVQPVTRDPFVRGATQEGRVNILAPLFFDLDGTEMMRGGGERYLLELVPLIESLGFDAQVYQTARGSWERQYRSVRVVGIDTGGDLSRLNERFHEVAPAASLTIYLAFYLAAPRCFPRSIGISHGVYWDRHTARLAPPDFPERMSDITAALSNLSRVISVDTNTINWVRASHPGLADRMVYLPNFVDLTEFRPRPARDPGDERLTILYPRRLYTPRGFWLVAEIVPKMLERYTALEFRFVGSADAKEAEAVRFLERSYPGRVRWDTLDPEQMAEAYRGADITLIPTVWAEGTSLSCLEAQASGNAVIATNVGGLPNLILHEYNGLLIEPTAQALKAALLRVVEDGELRERIGARAREVAQAYSIGTWRQRWREILREYLPPRAPASQS